jgi:polar amino acid transport system ATP-binding protein
MRQVTKAYGATKILDGLDLDVAAGEKVCIIGPSGSGKTTVLRVLMGLVRPDDGTVLVCGDELWRQPKAGRMVPAGDAYIRHATRNVGMVFQHYNLFPHMTAHRNVAEPLIRVKRIAREKAYDEAGRLLDSVGLAAQKDRRPAQLSGGQQQRVAIARALALRPAVMLFDEVTSALDPELVGEVLRVIEDIARNTNMAMILVTHEISFASHFSDRIIMFDGGRAIEQGPPAIVLKSPSNERTQRFLTRLLERG